MNSPGSTLVDLHDQVIRQNCRTLKTPTIAAQYQRLADAAAREGHSHVRYLDALLGAEIDERGRKAVLRRVKEARLPRLKTLQEFTSPSRRYRRRGSPISRPAATSPVPSRSC
jgi:DNA replication protein DnaC